MSDTMSDEEFERWFGKEALAEAKARPPVKPYTPDRIVTPEESRAETLRQIRAAREREARGIPW